MVRFAANQLTEGRLPLTSWFPFLGLGSPQFLHYQSLPAMLTGLAGLIVAPDAAFRWSLYLMLALWPVSVYLGARLLGLARPAAGASAAMSPFLVSRTGIGYEQHAYVWIGYGVWTQLWASMTLPLAWGFSWRAIKGDRSLRAAVLLVSLTVALHFETGYLALIPPLLMPFLAGGPIGRRLGRTALLLGGSLLLCAWVIVPLLAERNWAATNEVLQGTGLVNGYGAGRVLGWLAGGQLLDDGRLPVVTVLAAVGLGLAVIRSQTNPDARVLVALLAVCLLLSFGRTTFGELVRVLPGSGDIFFRRFMMGVQLAAVFLAGAGAVWCAGAVWRAFMWAAARRSDPWSSAIMRSRVAAPTLALVAAVIVLFPAWRQLDTYDARNASAIDAQARADTVQGAEVNGLIALLEARGAGRVYAGLPTNWGVRLTVGAVPVFKYLESRDVDEVGYTLRTASLMSDPEFFFDERDPGDYQLFGIRYLILPRGTAPPVPAHPLRIAGRYVLWSIGAGGYVHVGRIVGSLAANRTNIGRRSIPLLRSRLPQAGDYLKVDFGSTITDSRPPLPHAPAAPAAGGVLSESDHLDGGEVTATTRMRTPGVVVLSASFDPGWSVTVDGRPRPTEMVAPALVAAAVPAGTHTVVFRYDGYSGYPLLFALSGLTLLILLIPERRPSLRVRAPRWSSGRLSSPTSHGTIHRC